MFMDFNTATQGNYNYKEPTPNFKNQAERVEFFTVMEHKVTMGLANSSLHVHPKVSFDIYNDQEINEKNKGSF